MIAAASLKSIELMQAGDALRAKLQANIRRLREGLAPLAAQRGWQLPASGSGIQPLIIGSNAAALALSEQLLERGLWAPVIRPPTVPEGTARLRISLSAAHEPQDIDALVSVLREVPA